MINTQKTDKINIGNKKFIVLVGLMGSGKTSLGKALAKLVNLPFLDSDSKIENISGKTIKQLFHGPGEAVFRQIEEETIKDILNGNPVVLATGGGAVINKNTATLINKKALSIYMFIGKDFTPAMIDEVQNESPAQIAGLKKNDLILEIDGNKVKSIMDVSKYITMSTDDIIDFKVKRSYDELLLKIKPDIVPSEDSLGNKMNKRMVGIKLGAYNNEINHIKLGPVKAFYHAAHEVYYVSVSSLKYLGGMIVGKVDTSQLGGPIRIAKISGQVATFGVLAFISMMAYISISLGLVNLFPIPMLDGGHLMFYAFEKLLGRPWTDVISIKGFVPQDRESERNGTLSPKELIAF